MPRAFILGGNGQIGLATASRMLEVGWSVTLAHRSGRGVHFGPEPPGRPLSSALTPEPRALARALGSGADVLIDVIAYGPEHARQLLSVQGAVGALVVTSSASVYCDEEEGRTLDEAAETGFPELPVSISERQPTVEPGPSEAPNPRPVHWQSRRHQNDPAQHHARRLCPDRRGAARKRWIRAECRP